MDKDQLAEVLRVERGRHKLTMREVARAARTSVSVVSDIESARRDARLDTVRRILALYGKDLAVTEAQVAGRG